MKGAGGFWGVEVVEGRDGISFFDKERGQGGTLFWVCMT